MESWPEELPQQMLNGASIGDDESRLIQPMDAGPASVRNRFTAITQSVTTRMVLTGAQLAIFSTFFRTAINHGTNSFTWINPADNDPATIRFKTKPVWQCVKPDPDPDKRLWQASFDLEITP